MWKHFSEVLLYLTDADVNHLLWEVSGYLHKLFSMNRDSWTGPVIKGFEVRFLLWKKQYATHYIWDVSVELYIAAQWWRRDVGDVSSFQLLQKKN